MILFKEVTWRNMLSTGNSPITVALNRSPTTLIVGENGAGKSTIIDAICFALFNKGFRNVSKAQLLNSINLKQLEVTLEFTIGSKDYKVIRGVKPNKFEIYINDEQVNQDADSRDFQKYLEDQVLKLNYKSFTQIVILGSASFTPFMQLSQGHRREIIEDLLDIRVFSTMNALLKEKARTLNDIIKTLDGDLNILREKARIQSDYIKTLTNDQKSRDNETKDLIKEQQKEIEEVNLKIKESQTKVQELTSKIGPKDHYVQERKTLSDLMTKLIDRMSKLDQDIDFYHNNDNCPTCKQGLPHELKEDTIKNHKSKMEEINKAQNDIKQKLEELNLEITRMEDIQNEITEENMTLYKHNNTISASQQYIQRLEKDLEKNQNVANIEEEKTKLKDISKDGVALAEEKAKRSEDQHYQTIVSNLLKDTGIKTKIIKQYLPVINKLVNKYLAAMDFFVKFELDESFNETIKSRHRDEFTYDSFSEGEKQRIDLALMLTFRSVAKMKNTCNTNLVIMDEVFDSSLDHNGTDYLMDLLNTLGSETNVFVISHKGDILFDKFRSVIKFEKHQNFSRIARG